MNQMTIVIGILAAQIVNWLIAERVPAGAAAEMIRQSWNGQFGWRWMFKRGDVGVATTVATRAALARICTRLPGI